MDTTNSHLMPSPELVRNPERPALLRLSTTPTGENTGTPTAQVVNFAKRGFESYQCDTQHEQRPFTSAAAGRIMTAWSSNG